MKFIPRKALVASAAFSLLLGACSNGDEQQSTGKESGSAEVKKVGLMLQDISNPFFAAMQHRMEAKAKTDGFELNVQDGRQDLATQNDQIDTFIQQGVKLIIINAVDSQGIGSAISRAKAAGVTVVAVDVDASGADAAVTTDNVEAGKQACKALAEKIGGKGNILMIEGTPTTAPQERVKGCEEVLKGYPGIKILARQAGKNDRDSGLQLATDMLTANPSVQGIFAINDPEALGADLATHQANRKDIVIVGVDGSPEGVAALKDSKSFFYATPAQDPGGMVVKAYEVGLGIVKGAKPKDRTTLLNPKLVTRDTVSEYKGW